MKALKSDTFCNMKEIISNMSPDWTAAVSVISLCYRRLIAYFFGPLQETHCLFFWPATVDSLPVSPARYRRLLPVFFGPSSLTFSAESPIFGTRGWKRYFHLVYYGQEGDIFHIRGKNSGDRVPLTILIAWGQNTLICLFLLPLYHCFFIIA